MAGSKQFCRSVNGCDLYRSQSDSTLNSRPFSEVLRVLSVLNKYHKDLHRIGNIIQKRALRPAILTSLKRPHNLSARCLPSLDLDRLNKNKSHLSSCSNNLQRSEIFQTQFKTNHTNISPVERLQPHTYLCEESGSDTCSGESISSRDDENEEVIKKPVCHHLCQSRQRDWCLNNGLADKQTIISPIYHLHKQQQLFCRVTSKTPSAPIQFDLTHKQPSPLKSQRVLKKTKKMKTAPVNLKPRSKKKAKPGEPHTQTYSLSAWGEGPNVVQFSCSQEDLSVLRQAVVLSSGHSSCKRDSSQNEISNKENKLTSCVQTIFNKQPSCTETVHNKQASCTETIRNIQVRCTESIRNKQVTPILSMRNTPELQPSNDVGIARNGQICSSNWSSQDETEYKPKLTEEYTSSDTSNSHQTRCIWSKFSVNESEKTSDENIWEATAHEEDFKSAAPQHECFETYRKPVAINKHRIAHSKKQHPITKPQSSVKKSPESVSTRLESALILSELSTRHHLIPGVRLLLNQSDLIHKDSPDHCPSRKDATKTRTYKKTQFSPYLRKTPAVSTTPFTTRFGNPLNMFKNLRLIKSISSPDLTDYSEEMASQYHVLSQFIQLMYSQKILGKNFFKDIVGANVYTPDEKSIKNRKMMRKVFYQAKKRDAEFRSCRDRPFYIWKWRLFYVAFCTLLIFCACLALVATFDVFK